MSTSVVLLYIYILVCNEDIVTRTSIIDVRGRTSYLLLSYKPLCDIHVSHRLVSNNWETFMNMIVIFC